MREKGKLSRMEIVGAITIAMRDSGVDEKTIDTVVWQFLNYTYPLTDRIRYMEMCVEVYKRGIGNGACCTPALRKAFAEDVARGDTLDDLLAWLKRNPEVGRLDALRRSEQRELFLLSCVL